VDRNYESMMIVRPDLAEDELQEIFNKIIKKIEEFKGKVSASKIWAKERNFYFVLKSRGAEKKKYSKGCYWLINFTLDKDKIDELKEVIRLEERILRSVILNNERVLKATILKGKHS